MRCSWQGRSLDAMVASSSEEPGRRRTRRALPRIIADGGGRRRPGCRLRVRMVNSNHDFQVAASMLPEAIRSLRRGDREHPRPPLGKGMPTGARSRRQGRLVGRSERMRIAQISVNSYWWYRSAELVVPAALNRGRKGRVFNLAAAPRNGCGEDDRSRRGQRLLGRLPASFKVAQRRG